MSVRAVCTVVLTLFTGGCAPGLTGNFVGKIDCDATEWNAQLSLDKEERLLWVGTFEQSRTFENAEGFETSTVFVLDVQAALAEPSGVQDVDATFTCGTGTTTTSNPDGSEDVVEDCPEGRFADYTLRWDGEDRVQLRSDEQNCEGVLQTIGR